MEKKSYGSTSNTSGGSGVGSGLDSEMSKIHEELEEKNKELLELRHAHNKLKKALQDRSVELGHGLRRAEHSEAEVLPLIILYVFKHYSYFSLGSASAFED